MRHYSNSTSVLVGLALLVGFVLGCNYGSEDPLVRRAKAEGQVGTSWYAEKLQRKIKYVDEVLESYDENLVGVVEEPRNVYLAAACEEIDLPLGVYLYVKGESPKGGRVTE